MTGKRQSEGGWVHASLRKPDNLEYFRYQMETWHIFRRVRDAVLVTFWPKVPIFGQNQKENEKIAIERFERLLKEKGEERVMKRVHEVIDEGDYGEPKELVPAEEAAA